LSTSLHVGRNIDRCFRCGSHGGVIDFWSDYRQQTIADAAQEFWTIHHRPNQDYTTPLTNRQDHKFRNADLSHSAKLALFETAIDTRIAPSRVEANWDQTFETLTRPPIGEECCDHVTNYTRIPSQVAEKWTRSMYAYF